MSGDELYGDLRVLGVDYETPITSKTVMIGVDTTLLCERCWGRCVRVLSHPKFLKRLIKIATGGYSSGSAKAIERLNEALDKYDNLVCEKEVSAEQERILTGIGKLFMDIEEERNLEPEYHLYEMRKIEALVLGDKPEGEK